LPRLALPQLQLPWQKKQENKRSPVQAQRDELIALLLSSSDDGIATSRQQQTRASELVDALIDAGLPFEERLLGGGPWVVVYTRGSPQL
jgi:hypothetical protein